MPPEAMKVTKRPYTGVKKYHCVYMDGTGKIKFREFSCNSCVSTKYEDCTMDMYHGQNYLYL